MRVSDVDRDAAAGVLNAAFADGRLTAEEHGQRVEAAYTARTWQQLHQLTADLPAPPAAAELMAPAGVHRAGPVLAVWAAVPVPAGGDRLVAAVPPPPGHRAGCSVDPRGRARRGGRAAPRRAGQVLLTVALDPAGARIQLMMRLA
jgi:hypothetical protein